MGYETALHLHFIVYDPKHTITNEEDFIKAFEKHRGVWVGIVW